MLGLGAICIAAVAGPKFKIAAPLILVLIGIGVGFLPGVPEFEIDPELVLEGLLPPLLYSAAVSMPVMDFRREFGAISGLSILLVIIATGLGGVLLWLLIPSLDLAWAIALAAVISPTDAVATSIVKNTGISPRIISILEGEGLLNDASALVMLRTAVAATAASVTAWGIAGSLLWAVAGAALVGVVVGKMNLAVRSRISNTTATTVLSFAIPFIAMAIAEEIGASGLVAAVVAGLVTGQGAAEHLSPSQRMSDSQNWETIEFILEGTIFLTMGLEMHALVNDLHDGSATGILSAVGIAALMLVASVLIRAAFVFPLLRALGKRQQRNKNLRPHFEAMQVRLEGGDPEEAGIIRPKLELSDRQRRKLERRKQKAAKRAAAGRRMPNVSREDVVSRLRRSIADIDYFLASPLTNRDGAVIVWAGMRGAITVAAAQTLPVDTPMRSYLVFIAFLVATFSLLIQGGTLTAFVRWVKPSAAPTPEEEAAEQAEVKLLLDEAKAELLSEWAFGSGSRSLGDDDGTVPAAPASAEDDAAGAVGPGAEGHVPSPIDIIETQRRTLIKARDDRQFDSGILAHTLDILDASQIALEMRQRAGE